MGLKEEYNISINIKKEEKIHGEMDKSGFVGGYGIDDGFGHCCVRDGGG